MSTDTITPKQQEKVVKRLTAQEVAELMSQCLKDAVGRKITLRSARMISQIAASLSKVIETADLEDRIVEIERRLDEKDKGKKKY